MRRGETKRATTTSNVSKEKRPMNLTAKSPHRHFRGGAFAAIAGSAALLVAAFGAAPAEAELTFDKFDLTFTKLDGSVDMQAGAHPDAFTTKFAIDSTEEGINEANGFPHHVLSGELKNLIVDQVPGLVGDTTAYPRCPTVDFLAKGSSANKCSDETAIGVVGNSLLLPSLWIGSSLYNLEPPPGVLARIGFRVVIFDIVADVVLKDSPPYNPVGKLTNTPQFMNVYGSKLQLWGNPSLPTLDGLRGRCYQENVPTAEIDPLSEEEFEFLPAPEACEVPSRGPFLTSPASCNGPQTTSFAADAWQEPGQWITGSSTTHDNAIPPNPEGFSGCGKLGFAPSVSSQPTSDSAETGSGFDVEVSFEDDGLKNPDGVAQSQTKKAIIALPEGVTINPSIGEGLGVCTPAQLAAETLASAPGEGCPNASKIGTLRVESPLIAEAVDGAIFLAEQDDPTTPTPGAENPFDSLIAMYFVLRNTDLGVIIKLPAKVEPDPKTGQLVTILDDIPQLPFSRFTAHLREGQRAPLVTPAACGTYTTEATLYPWSDPTNPRTVLSEFQITEGVNGGPCPPGGVPPFKPHFEAGSLNNNAGAFSPFHMRLTRNDGEQDMTKFSSILPPGQVGSLAGVSKCPDAAIDIAKSKTGRQELASPSCPANSLIGHTLAGAGVGGALTYVGGQVYLGGPYKGAPLSVISITPAVAGPFDAGTVAVRLGLDLNPKTAEVEVDGASSDPIPHILKGIVLKLRDLRVYVDRPNFTLNPTSCDESSAKARLFGSFLDVFSSLDDVPVDLSTRYQAANCLNLGFKPDLKLNLKGGTKRGGHPGLAAIYTPRPGDANVEGLVVRLPRSAFLDQAHIRTICTRVQFAQDACPPGAQYGYIRAWTPLLDEPLQGPVWLRSSDHKLPDLVFDLHGLVDIEVSTRIDSARGGIRASLENLPDAPLSKVVLRMQGGKKGLIINSRDLCVRKSRAEVQLSGQNGKRRSINPVMRAQCGGKR